MSLISVLWLTACTPTSPTPAEIPEGTVLMDVLDRTVLLETRGDIAWTQDADGNDLVGFELIEFNGIALASGAPFVTSSRGTTQPHGDISVWYDVHDESVEQGFDVISGPGELRIVQRLHTDLIPKDNGHSVVFLPAEGEDTDFVYDHLEVFDDTGQRLPARLETDCSADCLLTIVVDAEHATYPVVVDPTFWINNQTLQVPGSQGLGGAVSVDGTQAAVGEPDEPSGGRVHYYSSLFGAWVHDGTLQPSDVSPGDRFGASVGVLSDYLAVGAPLADGPAVDSGRVYQYQKTSMSLFSLVKTYEPSLGGAEHFGGSVSLLTKSRGRVDIGAPEANNGTGAVYIALRSSPQLPQVIVDPAGQPGDHFGFAVVDAVDGGAFASAPHTAGGGKVLRLSDMLEVLPPGIQPGFEFGHSLAGTHRRLAVGAPGAVNNGVATGGAWLVDIESTIGAVRKTQAIWPQAIAGPGDRYGTAVGVAGGYLLLGSPTSGGNGRVAHYIDRGTSVQQFQILSGLAAGDDFGQRVAISRADHLLVAAAQANAQQGSVYDFSRATNPALTLTQDPTGPEVVWTEGDPPVELFLPGTILTGEDDGFHLAQVVVLDPQSSSDLLFSGPAQPNLYEPSNFPGVVHLQGPAPISEYLGAFDGITFSGGPNPQSGIRPVCANLWDLGYRFVQACINVEVRTRPHVTLNGWSLGNPLVVTENDPATDLTEMGAVVTDDSGVLDHVDVLVIAGGAEDVLAAVGSGAVTVVTLSNGIRFSGPAPVADFEQALDSLTYQNTSEDPAFFRQVVAHGWNEFGVQTAPAQDRAIQVLPINDLPVVAPQSAAVVYDENDPPTPLYFPLPPGVLTDLDDDQIFALTATLTTGSPDDQLSMVPPTGTNLQWSYPTLSITGVASLDAYRATLESLSFQNIGDDPGSIVRHIDVWADDPSGPGPMTDLIIDVLPVNDLPVVDLIDPGPITHSCGSPSQFIVPLATVTDPDSDVSHLAVDWVGPGLRPVLWDAAPGGLGVVILSNSIHLTGYRPAAVYQEGLRGLIFESCALGVHTLSVTATSWPDVGPTVTIVVNVVENPPVLTATTDPLSYTENSGPLPLAGMGWSLVEPDASDVRRCALGHSSFEPEESLSGNGPLSVFESGDDTIILGPASIAQMLTTLDAITYTNTSDDPIGGLRQLDVRCQDMSFGWGPIDAVFIDVIPVGDPPTLTGMPPESTLYTHDSSVSIGLGATIADPDSSTLQRVDISLLNPEAGDALSATASGSIAVQWVSPILSLVGPFDLPIEDFETVLGSLTFTNSQPGFSRVIGDRNIHTTLTDDTSTTGTLDTVVHVTDESSFSALGDGDLAINELHKRPFTSSQGEWFEVRNEYGGPIDLDGLKIVDGFGATHVVTEHLRLDANGYLVFGEQLDPGINGGVPVDWAYGGPLLGDLSGSLYLRNPSDGQLASMTWQPGTHSTSTGASLSLDPGYAANDPLGWCDGRQPFGDGDFGTPGQPNEACAFTVGFSYAWFANGVLFASGTTQVDAYNDGTFTTGNSGQGTFERRTDLTGQWLEWTYDSTGIMYSTVRPYGDALWCDGVMFNAPPGYIGGWAETGCP